jgi:hypothetical protein
LNRLLSARRGIAFAGISGAVVLALLATTIVVMGAKSPSAARWNHTAASGVRTAARAEASIPQNLIWQEIQVVEMYGNKLGVVDNEPGGDSIGDYVVFRDKLFDPNTDKQVGTIDVQCMSGFGDMCRGVVRLNNKGQITFDGMTEVGVDPDRYNIVGGGGSFADVGGVMRIDFPAEDHAVLTLTLTH